MNAADVNRACRAYNLQMDRRRFLSSLGATSAGFLGLHALLTGCSEQAPDPRWLTGGFGPLVPDPNGLLDLPPGFRYSVFSREGETMDDGLLVPGAHDGMACFMNSDGQAVLVRNHELKPEYVDRGAFGQSNEKLGEVPSELFYDHGSGEAPCLGGTSTLVFDTAAQKLVSHRLSLAGTTRNCAGGPTPWGSWVSCEESVDARGGPIEQNHGFNFEVPAFATGLAAPVPLTEMGRFNHEAIAVHPATGIVYQTEDRGDGLIYRFLPNRPGHLRAGGRLQALALADQPSGDTRNWENVVLKQGEPVAVRWVDLQNVLAPDDDLREQGFAAGAARFARGEGIWTSNDGSEIYFACTDGGEARVGQVFRYKPSAAEGQAEEEKQPGTLELFLESPDRRILEYCDNLTVAPWGDLVLCEDGDGTDHIIGVTPDAQVYQIGRNAMDDGEFAGACFSRDWTTLFVNIQNPGMTFAIQGTWLG